MIWIVIGGWLTCAVGAAGFSFAYWHVKYARVSSGDWREDLGTSILFGLLGGPIMLFVSFLAGGFGRYGWRLWPLRTNNGVTRHQ